MVRCRHESAPGYHGTKADIPGVKKVISLPKAAIYNKTGNDVVYAINNVKLEAKEVKN